MRVLFDTNVVLDLLFDRKPFSIDAARLFSKVEEGSLQGYLCATTITTIHYLAAKICGQESAKHYLHGLMDIFEIAPVHRVVLETALKSNFTNFEDAVIYEAARHTNMQGLITRNPGNFKKARIPIYTPEQLLKSLPG